MHREKRNVNPNKKKSKMNSGQYFWITLACYFSNPEIKTGEDSKDHSHRQKETNEK